MWHFQISENWKCTWSYNDYHMGLNYGWFKLHECNLFSKTLNKDIGV